MNNYLKDSRHDKRLGIALVFIYSVIFMPAILLFVEGIIQKEYLFSVLVVIAVLIVGLIIEKIEKLISKKMSNRPPYYVIPLKKYISYDELKERIDGFKKKKIRFDYSDKSSIFSFNGYFKYRIFITNQESFSLKKYKTEKKNVNHAYNKEYNISQSISPKEANVSLDINIIYCNKATDELYTHMSNDAEHCLTRVVALMEVAVVGNILIIPSIRKLCLSHGVNHYVRFNKLLFKLLDAMQE